MIRSWGRTVPVLAALLLAAACGGSTANNENGDGDNNNDGGPVATANFTETFQDDLAQDNEATEADWGATEAGILQSLPTTSRRVYCMGYQETWDGVTNGLGQYARSPDPLNGEDYDDIIDPDVSPATSFGRRVQVLVPDTKIGAAGTITGLAWGPHMNATFAATYDNVKLRLGYLEPSFGHSLRSHAGNNFESAPTLVYDGAYTVLQNANVGNTPDQPATSHVGGYAQNPGCTTTPGGWNKSLFDYTGFYDWPALTTTFDWSPGDFTVDNDRILIIDMSAVEGSTFQFMRNWFAVTFPCSGILIAGYPLKRLDTTYEADSANPANNFPAGVLNPTPTVMDTCITITRQVSIAQSIWRKGEYGDDTDYMDPVILPATQQGNARIIVEFQGADLVSPQGNLVMSQPFTEWISDIDECDGMKNIRFRIQLIPDPASGDAARVDSIRIPMADSNPDN